MAPRCAQTCLTLCDTMDCSLPGSSAHGIFQARNWSGLPFSTPRYLPDSGIQTMSLASPGLAGLAPPGKTGIPTEVLGADTKLPPWYTTKWKKAWRRTVLTIRHPLSKKGKRKNTPFQTHIHVTFLYMPSILRRKHKKLIMITSETENCKTAVLKRQVET